MYEHKDLYLCDPGKAETCGKDACYANGGPCYLTSNPEQACVKNGEAVLVMTKKQQDEIAEVSLDELADQTEIATKLAIERFNQND